MSAAARRLTCVDTTLQDPLVGQVLDGRYRVDARIAVGGMATVYRAVDTRLDRVLALKVMHPALAADAAFVERFIREAKSVARLVAPQRGRRSSTRAPTARTSTWRWSTSPGCTLRDVLRERGALRPRAALDILEPVLAALGAAHRAGLRPPRHEAGERPDRGRRPGQGRRLRPRAGRRTPSPTPPGTVLGTVSYLAPEQIEHGTADTRADVYACGVVLYEMLTGAKPHAGDTPAQVLYQHLNEDVPPPSAAVPGLAAELDELVATRHRPQSRGPPVRRGGAARAGPRGARRARPTSSWTRCRRRRTDRGPRDDGAEDRTSVIPRGVACRGVRSRGRADDQRTPTRLAMPPARRRTGAARRAPRAASPRRGVVAIVAAVLLVLGVGAGVWYINSGQFTQVPAAARQDRAGRQEGARGRRARREERRRATATPSSAARSSAATRGRRAHPGQRHRDAHVSHGPEIVQVPESRASRSPRPSAS